MIRAILHLLSEAAWTVVFKLNERRYPEAPRDAAVPRRGRPGPHRVARTRTGEAMTEREPWLGHRDLCPIQWGEDCDCDNGPEYLAEQEVADG